MIAAYQPYDSPWQLDIAPEVLQLMHIVTTATTFSLCALYGFIFLREVRKAQKLLEKNMSDRKTCC